MSSKKSIGFSPPLFVLSTAILELPMLFSIFTFDYPTFFRDEGKKESKF